jgi:hypothetical protein
MDMLKFGVLLLQSVCNERVVHSWCTCWSQIGQETIFVPYELRKEKNKKLWSCNRSYKLVCGQVVESRSWWVNVPQLIFSGIPMQIHWAEKGMVTIFESAIGGGCWEHDHKSALRTGATVVHK